MTKTTTDANLLFGVLAVQLDFVEERGLLDAMKSWASQKTRPLADVLVEQGRLTENRRQMLEQLVSEHVAMHQNDAEQSLASLSIDHAFLAELETLGDEQVHHSLSHLTVASTLPTGVASESIHGTGTARPDDVFATQVTPPVGKDSTADVADVAHAAPRNATAQAADADEFATIDTPPAELAHATAPVTGDSTRLDGPTAGDDPKTVGEPAEESGKTAVPKSTLADQYRTQVTPPVDDEHGTMATPVGGDPLATQSTKDASTGQDSASRQAASPGESTIRYRRVRHHARGGLGQVSVAIDEELRREVALKELQTRHADHRDSRDRFVLEAEITGRLEHPGIVPVYGLGHFEDGRPYYAMRFIRGDNLKEAIDRFHDKARKDKDADPGERELEFRKLLGRFIDVCNAIEYSHSRGVLHRDLKPGNVMLGNFGETLVVDWGLAKPMHEEASPTEGLSGSISVTSLSGSTGTMSGSIIGTPAYMSPEQAKGRLDLLGPAADIYSLGATLFHLLTGKSPFTGRDVSEILRRVERGEFDKPSKVNPAVPPALEAVCLKAMSVEIEDRYPSAAELAEDIEHWLADEPVSAWTEPWQVRLRRWLRKHRTMVTSTAVAVVVGFVSLLIIVVMLGVANEKLAQARDAEKAQKEIAKKERDRAAENFQMAREAVERFFTSVSENVLLNQPGMQPLRKKLLEDARDYHRKFIDQPIDDPDLKKLVAEEIAKSHFYVGRITEIIETPEKALDAYGEAEKQQRALVAENASDKRLADLGTTLNAMGRVHHNAKNYKDAEEKYKDALAVRKRLSKQPEYIRQLANTQMNLGDVEKERGDLAGTDQAAKIERYDAARTLMNEAQNTRQQVAADERDVKLRRNLAMGHYNLSVLERDAGNQAAAVEQIKKTVDIFEGLVAEGDDLDDRRHLAVAYSFHGDLVVNSDADLAKQLYEKARQVADALARANPNVHDYRVTFAQILTQLADTMRVTQQPEPALQNIDDAIRQLEPLAKAHPSETRYQHDYAYALFLRGLIRWNADGLQDLKTARELLTPLAKDFAQDAQLLKMTNDLIGKLETSPKPKDQN